MKARSVAAALAGVLALTACTSDVDEPNGSPTPAAAAEPRTESDGDPDAGFSAPVEDRVYPSVGDPGVDALHYDLTLTWDPDERRLDAREKLTFRAVDDADEFQLDLGEPLEVGSVTVDGVDTAFEHDGKDLVVDHAVREDDEHTVFIRYSGTPKPVPAPVERADFSSTGWTITDDGGVWTMQEPYGAYSWYAVNDQPSDKALYDITIRAPAPMIGVANGELVSRRTAGGRRTTHWRLDEPAASYLVTVAIDELRMIRDRSFSGVPITYWTPPRRPELIQRLRTALGGLAWLEDRLGPYPFDSLGFLVVDSRSGMETQTMITLGDTRYATSPEVLVHEMAHHWYGDSLTPVDWRDVWMNEGMATYLQGAWQSYDAGLPLDSTVEEWHTYDERLRSEAGPPADYDPDSFGSGNVYYIPAVMWHELRQRLGDPLFWQLVREWPEEHENGNAGYDEITAWWSERSGEDLDAFFSEWLLSEETPPS